MSWCGAKARVRFQSNGYWAVTDWSNEADRAVGSSRFWPQSRSRSPACSVRRSIRPAQPGSRATPASTRMRLTWMRPRQGPKPWSLTIITAAPRFSASSQSTSDRVVQTADHLGGGAVPFGSVDARLVDVQIGPDAVLERVEVLKLDHQHRPVGDESVGEHAPSARPRKLSAVSRAFLVSSSSD